MAGRHIGHVQLIILNPTFYVRMIFILVIIGLLDLNVSFSTEFVEELPSELQPDPSTMQEVLN